METIVYNVALDIQCEQYDMDQCRYLDWGTEFENMFATKRAAIKVAQSKFAKQPVNDYVKAVHAAVYKITITDKGMTGRKRIYNLYKDK